MDEQKRKSWNLHESGRWRDHFCARLLLHARSLTSGPPDDTTWEVEEIQATI